MIAILIKKLGPTQQHHARYKAMLEAMCVVTPHQWELNEGANAAYAARELVDQYNAQLAKQKAGRRYEVKDVAILPTGDYCATLKTRLYP